MTTPTTHPPGTPSWVDLATPDLGAAVGFYGALLGWTTSSPPGGYQMLELRGFAVAGAVPIVTPGHPTAWTTYIAVDDADEVTGRIEAAGGTIVRAPFDAGPAGRVAVFSDPTGAVAALWQAGAHAGAGIVNEPGALCWNELTCREPEAAKAFYGEVFGWTARDGAPGGQPYTRFALDGRDIAGMIVMDARWPAHVPAHWMPYFAVTAADETAERCRALGGTVTVPPFETPVGRMAVLADPAGAAFSVIALP